MMNGISFSIPGQPQGKGRPKFARRGNFVGAYTPKETVNYENLVKMYAQEAMNGQSLIDGPVSVEISAYVMVPESWSKKKKVMALSDQVYPTTKPDVDNFAKACLDSLNGIVWKDDKQVIDLKVMKRYSDKPCVLVNVLTIG
jgi:Holliday junction resolvase RusA-like endonuclease